MLKQTTDRCVVGLGGELNNTSCILNAEKAFLSQHIGDVENLETRRFLKDATRHLIHLTNSKIDTVACDLHPKFTTTHLAQELAAENEWELVLVQHHHAHVAALMAEHGIDELVGVACDGYGYGVDGSAWGGEVLLCRKGEAEFKRLAHLEPQPLPGGDMATRYPIRLAAALLSKKIGIDDWLLHNSGHLPHGETEARLILSQLQKPQAIPQTTSLGRVLDAAAAIIGVCYERTYEGEAAMKLESAAVHGKDALDCLRLFAETFRHHRMLTLFMRTKTISKADLAYSVHAYLQRLSGFIG
jgi:hydrogenase maturation protein HypF